MIVVAFEILVDAHINDCIHIELSHSVHQDVRCMHGGVDCEREERGKGRFNY